MADSTVTFTSIDEEFPIAGKDNDSQGFRDNFSEIKQSLQNANTELSDLLTNVARVDRDNIFSGNLLADATLQSVASKSFNTGTINEDDIIEWSNGHFQNITVGADVTLTIDNWPENGRYGHMRMAFRSDGANRSVVLEAANGGSFRADPNFPGNPITVTSATDPLIIDAWTTDGGTVVYLKAHGVFTVLS